MSETFASIHCQQLAQWLQLELINCNIILINCNIISRWCRLFVYIDRFRLCQDRMIVTCNTVYHKVACRNYWGKSCPLKHPHFACRQRYRGRWPWPPTRHLGWWSRCVWPSKAGLSIWSTRHWKTEVSGIFFKSDYLFCLLDCIIIRLYSN